MKMFPVRSLIFVMLVFLFTNNGAGFVIRDRSNYMNPFSWDHFLNDDMLYDSDDDFGLDFIDCEGGIGCPNFFKDLENKINEIILDFDVKKHSKVNIDNDDENDMSNEVPIFTTTPRDNTEMVKNTENNIIETDNDVDKLVEIFDPNTFSDNDDIFNLEKNDHIPDLQNTDYFISQDEPLLACDFGGGDSNELAKSYEPNTEEIVNGVLRALTDIISKDSGVSDEAMEWTDDDSGEPHTIVENGYIFYDMGSQE